MARILVIDDYQEIRQLYSDLLIKAGHQVETAAEAQEGVTKIIQGGYDLILLDLLMPKHDGLWVLESVRDQTPLSANGKIMIMGFADDQKSQEMIQKALDLGACGFLDKKTPLGDELLKKIQDCLNSK